MHVAEIHRKENRRRREPEPDLPVPACPGVHRLILLEMMLGFPHGAIGTGIFG